VKRIAAIAAIVVALLLGSVWFIRLHRAASLPRQKLVGGGEFRVVKVCYGIAGDHHLGGAPKEIVSAWNYLPAPLRRLISYPGGDSGLVPVANHTGLSIYWAFIDPVSQKPEFGPSGEVFMTTDSGQQTKLGAYPFQGPHGGGYRQIFVDEPPRNSSKLHFRVPVEDETVEFTITNPAYNN
jgi:hypothetical protein